MCLCVVLKWTRIPSRVYSCLTDSIPGIASGFTVNLIRSKWENTVRDRSHRRWEDHVIHFPLYCLLISPSWHQRWHMQYFFPVRLNLDWSHASKFPYFSKQSQVEMFHHWEIIFSSRVGCLDRVRGSRLNLLSSTIPSLSLSPSLPLQLLHGLRQIVNGLSLLLIPGR